jgi:hypothetical protein
MVSFAAMLNTAGSPRPATDYWFKGQQAYLMFFPKAENLSMARMRLSAGSRIR